MLQILRKIFVSLSIILLSVIIVFLPLVINVHNFNTYDRLYEKNSVYDYMSRNDAESITQQVFDFFRHEGRLRKIPLESDIPYFTNNEISHLEDVRTLLDRIFILFYLSLFGFFLFIFLIFTEDLWQYFKRVSYILISSSGIVLLLLLVLYILGSNFTGLFTDFHLVFFPQGNWTFPQQALIINIFPFGFFYDFFMKLVISSLIISIVFIFTGSVFLVVRKKIFNKKRKEK